MDTKFDMVKTAHAARKHNKLVVEGLQKVGVLAENVTSVLANIAVAAEEGKPIDLMNQNSIPSFLAGVEAIANALPHSQEQDKKENTIRVLAAASIGRDGMVTYAVTPIAQLGARKDTLRAKYAQMVNAYAHTGDERDGAILAQAVRQLQMKIDQAMRVAAAPVQNQPAKAGASQPGSTPGTI